VPRVTRLRPLRGDRVALDLDGARWRDLPTAVVVRAGLREGADLDRPALRALGSELRRHRALAEATRALRHADLSRRALDERLRARGASADAAAGALATLERAGLVDDERVAAARARALAGRGYGDAAIRADLERRRLDPAALEAALALLEPETERARRLVEERGSSPRTAGLLARRGFSAEAIEGAGCGVVADPAWDA
jgi:SOS response regulatory protein OraA/RecX